MSDSEKRRPQRVREADAPDGEFWTVVSKPGADPVMLSGPGLCRAMCSVSRDDFERTIVTVEALSEEVLDDA